jgi:hypothetical protein
VEGHIVISDPSEAAKFTGALDREPKDWNEGAYGGVKSFDMRPGDWFATVLVPNSTFAKLAENPGTESAYRRPLFSLVASDPTYGMCLGQIADVNGMGMAYSYEDINAATSDRDYNDLIIQITGAAINDVPDIDSLTGSGGSARSKRNGEDWFDWRSETELGRKIMEHLEAQIPEPDTVWLSADVNTDAELLAYAPDGSVIGEKDGHIPGATFGTDIDGYRFVRLPEMETGDYRLVIRGEEDGSAILTVRRHRGESEILSEESESLSLEAHKVVVSELRSDGADVVIGAAGESAAGPYDFDGNGVIDDADIERVSGIWDSCEGDAAYDPFYDLDGDGCVSVLDVMSVAGGSGH